MCLGGSSLQMTMTSALGGTKSLGQGRGDFLPQLQRCLKWYGDDGGGGDYSMTSYLLLP